MKIKVETCIDTDLSDLQIKEILRLNHSIWPDPDRNLDERVKALRAYIEENYERATSTHRLVIWKSGRAIANGKLFPRKIFSLNTQGGIEEEATVLALAGVCTALDYRGCGLGVAIVKKAFESLEQTMPFALFQTDIPEFYEGLGARVVDNKFVDRQNADNPMANPWWNEYAMVYPASCEWWKSTVDLNGPAW